MQEVEKRVTAADNVMYVAIPLNQPASRSVADVKALIEDKQRARLIEQGQDPETVKSLSAAFGKYSFTQGVEIRGKVLYEIQLMYGIWQDMGKPAVNTAFITEVVESLESKTKIQMDALSYFKLIRCLIKKETSAMTKDKFAKCGGI